MDKQDPHIDKEALLGKWLVGTLSDQEKQILESEEELDIHRKNADAASQWEMPAFDTGAAWEKFAQQVDLNEAPPTSAQVRAFPRSTFWGMAIAAGVALLILGYWILQPDYLLYTTEIKEQLTVNLPDASIIQMNADTRIEVEKGWEEKPERRLVLEGEGYFKVEKQPEKPFVVQTEVGFVKVLGTQFNVWAREGQMEVSCFEGAVEVSNIDRSLVDTLYPNQSVRIAPSFKDTMVFEGGNKPSWTGKIQRFKGVALGRVLTEVGRRFGVEIDASRLAPQVLSRPIRTAFSTDKTLEFALDNILESLENIQGIPRLSYKVDGNNVIIISK